MWTKRKLSGRIPKEPSKYRWGLATMFCQKCGARIPDGIEKCPSCGALRDGLKYCKHCGKMIDRDCVVCPKCGKQTGEIRFEQPNIVINNSNNNQNINRNGTFWHRHGCLIGFLLFIFWPISLSFWFYKTDDIQIPKKTRIVILAVAWGILLLISAISNAVNPSATA